MKQQRPTGGSVVVVVVVVDVTGHGTAPAQLVLLPWYRPPTKAQAAAFVNTQPVGFTEE
jgi:hypothetical protein